MKERDSVGLKTTVTPDLLVSWNVLVGKNLSNFGLVGRNLEETQKQQFSSKRVLACLRLLECVDVV